MFDCICCDSLEKMNLIIIVFLVVVTIATEKIHCFTINRFIRGSYSNSYRNHVTILASSLPESPSTSATSFAYQNDNSIQLSDVLKQEIRDIIEIYVDSHKLKETKIPIAKSALYDPTILLENAYVLVKGKLYEEVMGSLIMEANDDDETRTLQKIDAFLTGFIQSERKSRSRVKLNYILAGASSGRLDAAIDLLNESDEIDDSLISFIDSLIKKQQIKSSGPANLVDDDDVDGDNEDYNIIGSGKATLDVLRMVKRRLLAEIKARSKSELKLLVGLLQVKEIDRREEILLTTLSTVTALESFSAFVQDGLQHYQDMQIIDVEESNSDGSSNSSNDNSTGKRVEMSPQVYEEMKVVLELVYKIIRRLNTGFTDESVFSVNADDS